MFISKRKFVGFAGGVSFTLALLIFLPIAHAQTATIRNREADTAVATTTRPRIREIQQNIRDERVDRRQDVENLRESSRERIGALRNATGTREEVKGEIQDERDLLRESVQERNRNAREAIEEKRSDIKSLRREEITERRRGVVKRYIENVVRRMGMHIERLKNLAARIDSRIKKFETEGINMNVAKERLLNAREKIAIAESALATLKTTGDAIATSTENTAREEVIREVKESGRTVTQAIKDAHRALVDAVNSMKPGRFRNATTTPDQSTTTPVRQ